MLKHRTCQVNYLEARKNFHLYSTQRHFTRLREGKRLLARAYTRDNDVLKSWRSSQGIYLQACIQARLAVVAFEGTSRQPPLKRNAGGTASFPRVQLAPRTKYQFHRRKASRSTYIECKSVSEKGSSRAFSAGGGATIKSG